MLRAHASSSGRRSWKRSRELSPRRVSKCLVLSHCGKRSQRPTVAGPRLARPARSVGETYVVRHRRPKPAAACGNWRAIRRRISFAALRQELQPRKISTMASPQGSTSKRPRRRKREVQLIANGDLRLSANQKCWPAQAKMEDALRGAVEAAGYQLVRAHPYKDDQRHGFIQSQKEGMEVFRTGVDPDAPIIVAESVWQYSHHVLHGLTTHKGPILTAANWSGTWPGL